MIVVIHLKEKREVLIYDVKTDKNQDFLIRCVISVNDCIEYRRLSLTMGIENCLIYLDSKTYTSIIAYSYVESKLTRILSAQTNLKRQKLEFALKIFEKHLYNNLR